MTAPPVYELQPVEAYEDFYATLRRRLVRQVRAWRAGDRRDPRAPVLDRLIEHLLFLPDLFHLAARLVFDPEVPASRKGALIAGLAYVISPIDLIPDAIPLFGWVDDLIMMTLALQHFLDPADAAVRAAIERHWVGDEDLLSLLQHVLEIGESAIEFLPNRFIKLLKPIFGAM